MELILIRHGLAEDRVEFAKKNLDDQLRPLTLKGRKRLQKICVRLQDFIGELDLIVSSPLTRARQTAEIVAQIYFETKVVEAPELVPQGPPQAFLKWLRVQGKHSQRIVVVGHEPQLSNFISYLLAGKTDSFIDLKKGGVVCLRMESFAQAQPESAELLWAIPPKFFTE